MGRIRDFGKDFADRSDFETDAHKVIGFYCSDENEILDVEIGEVTLSNIQDMPFEIEINGIIYKRES